jgi:hypothetical protein
MTDDAPVKTAYRLPDGQIIHVQEELARGAQTIGFTLRGGEVVDAVRVPPPVNRVVTDPPQRMTLAERDATLEALILVIAKLLYQARECHTLGVASVIPFEHLPQAWRQDLHDAARAVVMHESLPRRQDADVAARAYLTRWLEAEAVTQAPWGTAVATQERRLLERFIERITGGLGPSVVTEVLHSYQAALCGPETRTARAQVARAAFATHTSGGVA